MEKIGGGIQENNSTYGLPSSSIANHEFQTLILLCGKPIFIDEKEFREK